MRPLKPPASNDLVLVRDPSTTVAIPEKTHPGELQSNGKAERAVRSIMDMVRTLKAALEARLQVRIPCSHPLIRWLVGHAAWILNVFVLGPDGRTAYGRLHGVEARERVAEFGERVLFYTPKKSRAKLDAIWKHGVFLGRVLGSDQN